VLRRKDKRRYILVYVNDQIFTDSSQLIDDSTDSFYYNMNSKICNNKDNNLLNNSQEKYKNNNIMMPKKNKKYNYRYNNKIPYFIRIIKKRFYELFGSIEFEKASINIIYEQNFCLRNCFILRCNIKSADKILFALSCCYPPLTTIKISGTLKKLISSIEILRT
jgi:Rpp14/Pop5 family